jgi:hypothetical protein
MTFDDLLKELAPFETFDKKVFVGDSEYPQNVCDYILSFALACNDFRDIFSAHLQLTEIGIIPEQPKSTKLGLRNGLRKTLIRVQIGFVHEILKLIENNKHINEEPSFKIVLTLLSREGKDAWNAISSVALNKKSNEPIAKTLVIIRNKIAFHYNTEEIGRSYINSFVTDRNFGIPLVSRGNSMKSTRFYFADAVAQHYLNSKSKDRNLIDFLNGQGEFILKINRFL